MKISRSIRYALLAMGYIVQHQDEKIILSQDISKKYDIPLNYLLKILQQLVRANILRSKKGPHGGFSLARPAKKITMLQIIEAVDGPMMGQLNLSELTCRARVGVRADKAYEKVVAKTRAAFAKIKLSELS